MADGDESQQSPEDPWAAAEGHIGPPPPPKWGQDQPAAAPTAGQDQPATSSAPPPASTSAPPPASAPAAQPGWSPAPLPPAGRPGPSHPWAGGTPIPPTNGWRPSPAAAPAPSTPGWTPPPFAAQAPPSSGWTPPPGGGFAYAGSQAYPTVPYARPGSPVFRSTIAANVTLLLISAITLGLATPVGLIVSWSVALRRRRFSGSLLAGPARPWYFWALVWTMLLVIVILIYAIVGAVQANNNSLPAGGSIYPWTVL